MNQVPDEITHYPGLRAFGTPAALLSWDAPDPIVYVSPRTWNAFVSGIFGNAKARRRWRRRNVPNTQREKARAVRAGFKMPINMPMGGPRVGLKGEIL